VCLNWGCIPSKALISTAHLYEKAASASEIGIVVDQIRLEPNQLQDWKEKDRQEAHRRRAHPLEGVHVDIVEGAGKVVAADAVEVTKKDGSKERLQATKGVVVATGSETIEIPGFPFDGKSIIGAKEAVSLRQIPKRLVVIGGGVIGSSSAWSIRNSAAP